MSRVYFMRHAKAVDPGKDGDDFDRELSPKGKDDAKFMASRLKSHGISLDAIFSSDAKRCEQTAKRVADALNFSKKITFERKLYDASFGEFLSFLQEIDDKFLSVFIIAHNPATTQICEFLSDSSIGNIPTGGMFCIELNCDFKDVREGCGRAIFFDYPKKHQK